PRSRVAAAPCQHNLCTVVERLDVRLRAHHANDALSLVDGGALERRHALERRNLALLELLLDPCLGLLGVDRRQLETATALARHLPHDVDDGLEVRLTPGAAATRDHHWNLRR